MNFTSAIFFVIIAILLEAMFVKHGPGWISFPETDYTGYEGSHLDARSVSRFSLDSAIKVNKQTD